MYSAAWVSQFEIKDMHTEFVINNVSPQGNCEDKIEFKIGRNLQRLQVKSFCEINDNAPGFCLALSEAYL